MEPHQNIALSFKCPKQLNQLHPVNGDYYCDGCQKTVHDFRGMTEAQVLEAMSKSARQTCGIFESERITVLPQIPRWLKWASAAMVALGMTACDDAVMGKPIKQENPQNPTNRQVKTPDYFLGDVVEVEPSPVGGMDAFYKYLNKAIKNPKAISGRAIVTFTIEGDGSASDIKILRTPDHSLDSEIINVIKHMPKWRPGFENGKPARVQYALPINLSK